MLSFTQEEATCRGVDHQQHIVLCWRLPKKSELKTVLRDMGVLEGPQGAGKAGEGAAPGV